jgi:hypothetical protein
MQTATDGVVCVVRQGTGLLRQQIPSRRLPDKSMFVPDSLIGEGGFGRVICSMFLPTKKW